MSLLQAVDEAVRMCKDEQSKLTENIRQCKEILSSMRTCVTVTSELETASAVNTKDDIRPEEKQEIELLERVLKKALKIRSTSEAHKDLQSDSNQKKHPHESKNKTLVNPTVKEEDKRKPAKSVSTSEMCKTANQRRAAGASVTNAAPWTRPAVVRKKTTAHPLFRGRPSVPKISSMVPQHNMCGKPTNAKVSCEDHFPSVSCQEVSASGKDEKITTGSMQPSEQWIPSPLLPAWRSQRTKQNRLWKKVLTQQSKPISERTQFTERLRATFPSEWPSRSPADLTTELERLSQRCLDLTHHFHAELQAQKHSDSGTLHERQYESLRMLEGLERMAAELLTSADHWKKDWERWEKSSSASLCPVRRRGDWGDPDHSCLPPILSYSSEAELRELERQRLKVQQLQQALLLQQSMSDNLASYWDCTSEAKRPSAVVFRGLYSLLAEGGLQFPSLVLDSE